MTLRLRTGWRVPELDGQSDSKTMQAVSRPHTIFQCFAMGIEELVWKHQFL